MADEIGIDVDVDSTPVDKLTRATDRLGREMREAQGRFTATGTAANRAGQGIQSTGTAATRAEREVHRMGGELRRLQGHMRGVVDLGAAVRGAFLGFAGYSVIRSLQQVAGEMQRTNMTFMQVTGSAQGAAREMAYVSQTADRLGQDVRTAAGAYARLLAASSAASMPLQDTRNVFEGLTAAATAFGLSQYELEGALNAVQQMLSKGSVQAEELRGQLGERLPGAYQIAADAMGMTTQQLSKALELGAVSADRFVSAFGKELQNRFGAFAESADTSTRKINELENAIFDLQKRIVEGGFMDAMISVLELLTQLASTQAAQDFAEGMGSSFRVMAENAELATIAIGGMVAIVGAIAPIPAAIAGVTAALTFFLTRTQEVGYETVSNWDIVKTAIASVAAYVSTQIDNIIAYFRQLAASTMAEMGLTGQHIEGIQVALDVAMSWVKAFVQGAIAQFAYFQSIVAQIFSSIVGGMKEMSARVVRDIGAIVEVTGKLRSGDWSGAGARASQWWGEVKDDTRELIDLIGEVPGALTEMHQTAGTAAKEVSAAAMDITTYQDAATAAVNATKEAYDDVKSAAAEEAKVRRQNAYADQKLMEAGAAHRRKEMEAAAAEAAKLAGETAKTEKATKGAGAATKKLTEEEKAAKKAAEELKKTWEGIAESIGEALLMIGRGDWTGGVEGLLGGIQQALMQSAGGKAAKAEADMIGAAIADAFRKLGNSKIFASLGLEGAQAQAAAAQMGVGLAGAASAALQGDMKQVGVSLGSTAGQVLGRVGGNMVGKAIGGTLGSMMGPIGSVIGGALGGLLGGKLFGGGGTPMERVSGTVLAGTPFERRTSIGKVLQKDTRDYSARVAAKGIMEAINNDFRGVMRDMAQQVASRPGDINLPTRAADGRKVTSMITGEASWDDVTKMKNRAQGLAEKFERDFMEVVDLALSVTLAGVDRVTEVQQQFRQIQDQFSGENLKILTALGYSKQQIDRARAEYVGELRQSFEGGLIQTIVDSGKATKDYLVKWRDSEIAALRDSQRQAVATAQEIGASVEIVNEAYRLQIEGVQDKFKEMLEEIGEAVDHFARARANASTFGQIIQTAPDRFNQNDVTAYAHAQKNVLISERNDAIKEAEKLGADVLAVRRLYNLQILALEEQTQDRLRHIRTRTQDFMVGMFETIRDLGGATMADAEGWMAARRVQIEAEREAALERARALGVSGVLINRAFDLQLEKLADQFQDFIDDIANAITAEQRQVVDAALTMARALRQAHDQIAETIAELQIGDVSPLGRQARLAEAQAQFQEAVSGGMGGDVEAAQRAAQLAQTVLGLGQQVYGSSSGYADLFAQINQALTQLQTQTGQQAESLEARLASETLEELTRQSEIQQVGFSEMVSRLDSVIASLEAQRADARRQTVRTAAQ